ncbi:FMRFamide receptor [Papilio xuthus]|uniref:FMRFamide receptor n=1 Tax=Papilio xuthus TaxID=66420 RepID=A0A194PLR6_PAPXU|nr:FMRFamide receptor [Papilio xuthus]
MTALPPDINITTVGPGLNLTNSNSTAKTNICFFESVSEQIANGLNVYYIPFLIILGAIGNLLSVYVFYKSKLRLQSTSQYLSALAISDTLFLLQLIPPWLNAVHFTDLFHRQGFCQIFVYISYVTCTFSAWIVVAFTIERFMAVLHPLQCNAICTVQRSRYVIMATALCSLLLNIPVLRFVTPTPTDCNIDFEYLVHAARFNIVDTVASFTVPLAVIIVLNVRIVVGIYRIGRERREFTRAEQMAVFTNQIQPLRPVGYPRSQTRVTRMLLIVSSVFVCLNLPAYTMRVIAYALNLKERESTGSWAALQQIALIFFNTNFGINFTLYCLSGQNFRRAVKNILPSYRRRTRRAMTLRELSPTQAPGGSATTSFISNDGAGTSAVQAPSRRRRNEQYITRWTFDNSRQRRLQANSGNSETIELRPIAPPQVHHGVRYLDPSLRSGRHANTSK